MTENKRTSTLLKFMTHIISQLKANGQHRTMLHYQAALNSFMRFRNNKDITLKQINADVIQSYEAYLKNEARVCRNTSSFYLRILRAVYNKAQDTGLTRYQPNPFRCVYTGIDKTRKRAIPVDAIKDIKHLDLSHSPAGEMAKDTFIMSYYLRGISFVDLAHLRKSDLRNGVLRYHRSKTRQQISIQWHPKMQALVDKYADKYHHCMTSSPYLFPFLANTTNKKIDEEKLYHNVEARITYHLKKIAAKAGIPHNLTLYVARHSWATAARDHNYPLSVISEALGHDSETTTLTYLNSIQASKVDQLNAEMIDDL